MQSETCAKVGRCDWNTWNSGLCEKQPACGVTKEMTSMAQQECVLKTVYDVFKVTHWVMCKALHQVTTSRALGHEFNMQYKLFLSIM